MNWTTSPVHLTPVSSTPQVARPLYPTNTPQPHSGDASSTLRSTDQHRQYEMRCKTTASSAASVTRTAQDHKHCPNDQQ